MPALVEACQETAIVDVLTLTVTSPVGGDGAGEVPEPLPPPEVGPDGHAVVRVERDVRGERRPALSTASIENSTVVAQASPPATKLLIRERPTRVAPR
jgi:hypothetical protein